MTRMKNVKGHAYSVEGLQLRGPQLNILGILLQQFHQVSQSHRARGCGTQRAAWVSPGIAGDG